MRECTFHPDLNDETYRITSNQEQRDTFDHLYSQAKIITKQKEEQLKEMKDKKMEEEFKGCTFKPNLEPSHQVDIDIYVPNHEDPLEERALKYAQEKKKRIGKKFIRYLSLKIKYIKIYLKKKMRRKN